MISDGYDENSRSGWIRLYRSSLLNGWLKNHKLWVFWCYCLLKASHKVRKVIFGNQQITLKPGQFIFGRKNAAHDTGLSEQSIRTCVESLKTLKNITVKSTNKFSIITIDNWELYQDSICESTNKTADVQPSGNQHVTTNKNDNNVLKDIYTVFEAWNTEKIITHRERSKFEHHIKARLQHYSTDEIKDAIKNYSDILKSDKHYFSHKWTLEEFLNRKGGLDKFLTVNTPFETFLKSEFKNGNGKRPTADSYNNADRIKELQREAAAHE